MLTNLDARNAVVTAIEADSVDVAACDEFDIDAIAEAVYMATGGNYDPEALSHDEFWDIVEKNAIPAVTLGVIQELYNSGYPDAVLYIKEEGDTRTLSVWCESLVSANASVLSKPSLLEWLGHDGTQTLSVEDKEWMTDELLPGVQRDIVNAIENHFREI